MFDINKRLGFCVIFCTTLLVFETGKYVFTGYFDGPWALSMLIFSYLFATQMPDKNQSVVKDDDIIEAREWLRQAVAMITTLQIQLRQKDQFIARQVRYAKEQQQVIDSLSGNLPQGGE